MTFDNFVFRLCLFLCLKNKDAQRKIDVSCLSMMFLPKLVQLKFACDVSTNAGQSEIA